MNKKVVLQIGCFLVMLALEMIAAYINPASAAHNVLLVLAALMIPVFVLVGRAPIASEKSVADNSAEIESPLPKAA